MRLCRGFIICPVYLIIALAKVNRTGKVCVESLLMWVNYKKLLQPRIYTCEFEMKYVLLTFKSALTNK